MAEFFKAALPWVVMGLTVAALAANAAKRKKDAPAQTDASDTNKKDEKKAGNYMSEGMSLGMCIGVSVGTAVDNLALGLSLGMLMGLVVGMNIPKNE